MVTSSKTSARILAEALYEYGVRQAVVSPGSRNTPLVLALDAMQHISKHTIIDERSAAFAALGMALQSGRPVACVCTSGSAVLDYAPAVAEAYYRGVPLIVISADRPLEWIDQDDSQTIHQYGVLKNIVKASYNISDNTGEDGYTAFVNRTVNDAMSAALGRKHGPVHINMEFREPLGVRVDTIAEFRKIECVEPEESLPELPEIHTDRIMIVAGFHTPDEEYSELLFRLWTQCGIPVLSEAQSNVYGMSAPMVMKAMACGWNHRDVADYRPALVISTGGAVVSKDLKNYLRETDGIEHWHVGYSDHSIDCYRRLTHRFDMSEKCFLGALLRNRRQKCNVEFGNMWTELFLNAADRMEELINNAPWSDMKAIKLIMDSGITPQTDGMTLHLGNGTLIRIAQLCNFYNWKDVECNRGVSGIDGSVSTAVGAALGGAGVLLVCGDMSAQYDMGALAIKNIPDSFRMVVIDNGGGAIFRTIGSTGRLDRGLLERYFCGNVNLPLGILAKAFGFEYFEAASENEFNDCYYSFLGCGHKAILRVVTDPHVNESLARTF